MHWHRRIPFVLTAAGVLCARIRRLGVDDVRLPVVAVLFQPARRDGRRVEPLFNGGVMLAGAAIALRGARADRPARGVSRGIPGANGRARVVPPLIAALGSASS